ncbi:MAG: radical SAM protein [bacterium]
MDTNISRSKIRRPGFFSIFDSRRRLIHALDRGLDELDYPPLFLWVESASRCNLKCPMCPQSEGLKRAHGEITTELLEKIVSEATGRVQLFSLHFGGEPLLNRKLPEIIKAVTENGIIAVLHSNGVLAGAETARKFIDAGLDQIVFSFDAVPREEYSNKRSPADFDKTYAAIREFLEEKKRIKSRWPMVTVKSLIFYGQAAPDAAAAELRSLFAGLPVDNFAVEYAHSFSGSFAEKIVGEQRYLMQPRGDVSGCILPWYGFSIGWDGSAYACCNDLNGEYSLGNVNESSLLDIWNGPAARRLRRNLADRNLGELPLCAQCDAVHRRFSTSDVIKEGVKFSIKHAVRPAIFSKR